MERASPELFARMVRLYNACRERPIDLCETALTAGVAAEPHDTSPVTAAAKGRFVVVQLSGYPSSAARQSVVRDRDDLERPGHSRTKSHRRVQRLPLALYENVRGRIVPDQPIDSSTRSHELPAMFDDGGPLIVGSFARTSLFSHSAHQSATSRCQSASRFPEPGYRSCSTFRS